MTPDLQREALAALAEVWGLSPDVRLGQLLAHLGFLGEAHVGRGLGYIEDDELLAILYRHRAELVARSQGTPNPNTVELALTRRKDKTCDRLVTTLLRGNPPPGRSASLRLLICGVTPADAVRRRGRSHAGAWEREPSLFPPSAYD